MLEIVFKMVIANNHNEKITYKGLVFVNSILKLL